MLKRDEWLDLARKLDWTFSYVTERQAFPEDLSGRPWLAHDTWAEAWADAGGAPCRPPYHDYIRTQHAKDQAIGAARGALGRLGDLQGVDKAWLSGTKLCGAALPLATFAASVGNLRAARFGRTAAWRQASLYGALDQTRRAQIPLLLLHELVRWDKQLDFTHRLCHTNVWVAIAIRHLVDELLLLADPIELALAANLVVDTGFVSLPLDALSAIPDEVRGGLVEGLLRSERGAEPPGPRTAPTVLAIVVRHDKAYAQYVLDKWFWRSWLLFAVVTGFTIDYLTPLAQRTGSFKQLMEERVIGRYLELLAEHGLQRPWYWDIFLKALDGYHHMVYLSVYTYRASVWFDLALPGPDERDWLREHYPTSWAAFDAGWERVTERWRQTDPGIDLAVHGTAVPAFCNLCQLMLCNGTPEHNAAVAIEHDGERYIFCSEPCRWLFEQEPERYAHHKDLVKRVVAGEASGNLAALLKSYCGLRYEIWGKDAFGGVYPWLERRPKPHRRTFGAAAQQPQQQPAAASPARER